MPKYAVQYERRRQREVLGRKGAFEAQLLFESESIPAKVLAPESPVSVLASVDYPELKPLTLPGAWTVVGKKGRPAKVDGIMYNEVQPKKKKRKRKSKTGDEPHDPSDELAAAAAAANLAASLRAALEEAPSTSGCVERSERTCAQHAKAATRGRAAKAWASYRLAKEEKVAARDALIDALAAEGMLEEDGEAMPGSPSSKVKPERPAPRKTDRNSHAQKTRRAKRFEAAAARCYSPEEPDSIGATEVPCAKETKLQKKPSAGVTAPLPETSTSPLEPSTPSEQPREARKDKKANCSVM